MGPSPCQDAAPREPAQHFSAFKAAEKRYKLHKEQQLRYSKGKQRGGKLVERPTDTSDVLDFAACRDVAALPPGVLRFGTPEGPCSAGVFGLDGHPGFCFIPGALSPALQQRIAQDALLSFSEPPNRSNHTVQYGPLPSLWQAAQQGLRLQQHGQHAQQPPPARQQPAGTAVSSACVADSPTDAAPKAPADSSNAPSASQQTSDTSRGTAGVPDRPTPAAAEPLPGGVHAAEGDLEARHGPQENGRDTPQAQAALRTSAPLAQCATSGGSSPSNIWSASGNGPSAAALLRQLRWVTIGSQFNWTTRIYEKDADTPPLPAYLRDLAIDLAELAATGCHRTCATQRQVGQAGTNRDAQLQTACTQSVACDDANITTTASHAAAATPERDVLEQEERAGCAQAGSYTAWSACAAGRCDANCGAHQPATRVGACSHSEGCRRQPGIHSHATASTRPFRPDAAILNYYHEGDMLGGHKDDVEADMDQPIVTISFGCDAIFLLGGESKEQPPCAMWVRSGDAMVLLGPARRCYHGVPRVFADQGMQLPSKDMSLNSCVEYFKDARVNISIRATN